MAVFVCVCCCSVAVGCLLWWWWFSFQRDVMDKCSLFDGLSTRLFLVMRVSLFSEQCKEWRTARRLWLHGEVKNARTPNSVGNAHDCPSQRGHWQQSFLKSGAMFGFGQQSHLEVTRKSWVKMINLRFVFVQCTYILCRFTGVKQPTCAV